MTNGIRFAQIYALGEAMGTAARLSMAIHGSVPKGLFQGAIPEAGRQGFAAMSPEGAIFRSGYMAALGDTVIIGED